ncbi:endonuclease/exonuclease/phosphatase family protein [Roseovarius sp. EL26]|uniref:endonuclease/exonuclease/phosphatase family protein n=1 Tax=Roseovarius sp. EL26 TaxID=2126672 RepID=UPI000EA0FC37|nr:endonuclease/exonuclease/phosphatase family protein [Roseovarius sp. EL26]
MRITSYNIRKGFGLDWRRDPDRVVDVLAEIEADIVVLQEADKRIGERAGVLPLERMAQELRLELADVRLRTQSHGWHGNAVFYRRDLSVAKTVRLDVPSVEPRGVVAVEFTLPSLTVYGVHLGLTPGMRRKQMAAIANHAQHMESPTIVAGDFNEWKVDLGRFEQSFEVVTPGPSFHASRPTAVLDRFALRGAVQQARSWVHKSRNSRYASDHLPIVMDFDLKETAH